MAANKPWQNKSGLYDPTAHQAIKSLAEEEQKVADLVRIFKIIARWAGFNICNRVEFEARESGRVYR